MPGTRTADKGIASRARGTRWKALEIVLRVVSVETRLKKIGAEISKATRRVNTFNEVVVPRLQRRIREIRLALEEPEREEIFRMKRFKKRTGGGAGF